MRLRGPSARGAERQNDQLVDTLRRLGRVGGDIEEDLGLTLLMLENNIARPVTVIMMSLSPQTSCAQSASKVDSPRIFFLSRLSLSFFVCLSSDYGGREQRLDEIARAKRAETLSLLSEGLFLYFQKHKCFSSFLL